MKHQPLFWLAIVFAAGIFLSQFIPSATLAWFLAATLGGAASGVLWWTRQGGFIPVLLIFFFVAFLGAACWSTAAHFHSNHIAHFVPDKSVLLRVKGTVCSRPKVLHRYPAKILQPYISKPETRTRFHLSSLIVDAPNAGDEMGFYGKIQVSVKGNAEDIKYGDRIRCLGWFTQPRSPSNPGEFDYQRYLARYRIHALLWVKNRENAEILSRGHLSRVRGALYKSNDWLRNQLYTNLSLREAALLDGLLLGNRDRIRKEDEQAFTLTGTRHILAISGLHIGLFAAAVLGFLRLVKAPIKVSYLLTMALTILYAFFTGGKPPSLRAAVMVSVFLAGMLLRRKSSSLNLLGLSALLILGYEPNQLFSVGFQLSFIAVLGIILLLRDLQRLFFRRSLTEQLMVRSRRFRPFRELLHYGVVSLCVPASAWLAIMPLNAFYFHLISPFSIFTNVFLCPLVFAILVVGMTAFGFIGLLPFLGVYLLKLAGCLTWLLQEMAHLLAKAPFAGLYVSTPSLWLIGGYYVSLVLFVIRSWLKITFRVWAFCTCLLLGTLFILVHYNQKNQEGTLRMTVLDVGHGCSTFVQFPNGKNMLYDVGAFGLRDIASWTVAPFLWNRGVTQIDRVILSHLDYDHYSGFLSLLDRFRIKEVCVSPSFQDSPVGEYLMTQAKEHGAIIRRVVDGTVLDDGVLVETKILSPPSNPESFQLLSDNDRSLVLIIRFGQFSVLLTGDIEGPGIRYLLRNHADDLKSQVLMIPHHGAFSPNSKELAEKVQAHYGVISGRSYRVNEETRKHYEDFGTKIHVTGEEGAIYLETDGNRLELRSFRELGR